MAVKESNIVSEIILAASPLCVIMKNVRGLFLTLDGKRKIASGLSIKGSSDLIGFKSILVTQDMVGDKIAQFIAIEVKTATGTASKEQKNFIRVVQQYGGLAGVARSEEDAIKIIENSSCTKV